MTTADFHPVAELFPLMTGTAFDELVRDIQVNGLREPIWTYEGKIVDGRNRFNACLKGGVSPRYHEWSGAGDLIAFVVSLNLHRRHLSESQRAMVASKIAGGTHGGDRHSETFKTGKTDLKPVTVVGAAELLNVNKGSVSQAKTIRRDGTPEVVAAVEDGRMSLKAAARLVHQPEDVQREAAAESCKPKSERVAPTNGKTTFTKTHSGRKAPEAVRGAIGTLVGLATGLDSFTAKDAAPTPDEAKQWERDLLSVISAVNRFRRQLKELSDGQATAAA